MISINPFKDGSYDFLFLYERFLFLLMCCMEKYPDLFISGKSKIVGLAKQTAHPHEIVCSPEIVV